MSTKPEETEAKPKEEEKKPEEEEEKAYGLVIHESGRTKKFELSIPAIQKQVGGYFTIRDYLSKYGLCIWVNEEGILPINSIGTFFVKGLAGSEFPKGTRLHGPVVIAPDEEENEDDEEDDKRWNGPGLTEKQLNAIQKCVKTMELNYFEETEDSIADALEKLDQALKDSN